MVFLTTKEDYDGFASILEEMGAKDLKHYYRPMYAKDLQSAMEVAPIIAHRPYDVIALDGYSKLEDKQYEELLFPLLKKIQINLLTRPASCVIIHIRHWSNYFHFCWEE